MEDVLTLILGGGRGTRLYPLTHMRSKPAVPIGGKYRLIDIPISNCLHAGLKRIFVLTQFNSASLHRHISQSYKFDHFSGGFVEILAAEQTFADTSWYQGTADAVRKHLHRFMLPRTKHILILGGDQAAALASWHEPEKVLDSPNAISVVPSFGAVTAIAGSARTSRSRMAASTSARSFAPMDSAASRLLFVSLPSL